MDQSQPVGPEAFWRAALADGRILLQRDPSSGAVYFPPRLSGPEGQALQWVEANGDGRIYSLTIIHPRPPQAPYNVALVDLVEGARLMTRVEGEGFSIGDTVRLTIATNEGGPLVVCHPA